MIGFLEEILSGKISWIAKFDGSWKLSEHNLEIERSIRRGLSREQAGGAIEVSEKMGISFGIYLGELIKSEENTSWESVSNPKLTVWVCNIHVYGNFRNGHIN